MLFSMSEDLFSAEGRLRVCVSAEICEAGSELPEDTEDCGSS